MSSPDGRTLLMSTDRSVFVCNSSVWLKCNQFIKLFIVDSPVLASVLSTVFVPQPPDTVGKRIMCLGCLSSHSSVRPFVYLLICQFPTDDLIRFWRWKVKDTAGWSIWWQRHPHRCWGIKVHLSVFVYFWPTYTVEGQTSNGRWRLSSSVPLAYAA